MVDLPILSLMMAMKMDRKAARCRLCVMTPLLVVVVLALSSVGPSKYSWSSRDGSVNDDGGLGNWGELTAAA